MTNADVVSPGPNTATDTVQNVTAQKVVIINGSADVLEVLETMLDAGHYDVIFVESTAHAYSQIKRVQPDLVILCVHMDDVDGLRVLSMLKLDEDTRNVPILTYTVESTPEESDDDVAEPSDAQIFAPKPALWMN